MGRIRRIRPTPATVIAFIALMVALAGTAEAVSTHARVRKGEIAKGAVTAKTLAKGAVHARALAKGSVKAKAVALGAVTPSAIASGAVTGAALAPDAVTSSALAPGSVYGGSLGATTTHAAPIGDLDADAHNGEWTASNTVSVACGVGERIVTGGVVFTNPGDRQVAIIQSVPFSNGTTQGWIGQITTDSGGIAAAEVQALCLK